MTGFLTDQVAMLFSTPITLSLVILEIFISVRYDKQYYKVKDTKANLVLGLGYVLTDTISRGAGVMLISFFYFYGLHPVFFFKPYFIILGFVSIAGGFFLLVYAYDGSSDPVFMGRAYSPPFVKRI